MTTTVTSDAYVLVTIPNATLTSPSSGTLTGRLALEYITFTIPASASAARDVLLVLRLGDDPDSVSGFEAPLDPARAITATVLPSGARRYVFHVTRDDLEFTLALPEATEDVDLFHSVLAGYATDLRGGGGSGTASSSVLLPEGGPHSGYPQGVEEDLRGRFILVNEDGGEIVGALDRSVRVREDPSLGETGHENDPVVVELPEDDTLGELRNVEVLVRTVPPEDRDWMMSSALFASYVISGTTTLLTSAMTSASNYYIAHSTPSPHASGAASPTPGAAAAPGTSSFSTPPPPPSRTLLLLQSPTTRSHLASIHAVSGGAVKLSHKATAAAERLIQRAVGADKGKSRASAPVSAAPTPPQSPGKPPLPPRSRGPSPVPVPSLHDKPHLPPRRVGQGTSPAGSRGPSPTPPSAPPPLPLRTRTRAALSATLILAALSASAVRLMDTGGTAVAAAVSHRYGAVAGDNAALAAGTMRNVVLVYVDVRGFGRKALVKRTARTWAKGRTAAVRGGVDDGRSRR
jgi:spartin